MICFQVEINGQKVATAGVGENGSLGAHLTWLGSHPTDPAQRGREQMTFTVSGFIQSKGETDWSTCKWIDRPMKVGDEITIRVVEQLHADPPATQGKIEKLLRPDPQLLLSHIEKAFASLREEIEKKNQGNYTI
jgi:hypothetical protein